MHFCAKHWTDLQNTARLYGIFEFQAKSPEEIQMILKVVNGGKLDDDVDPDLFDALLAMQCMVFEHALHAGGDYLMHGDKDGNPLCPMCECVENTDFDPQQWLDTAAQHVRTVAQDHGLVHEFARCAN